jgi:hypothetical protein
MIYTSTIINELHTIWTFSHIGQLPSTMSIDYDFKLNCCISGIQVVVRRTLTTAQAPMDRDESEDDSEDKQ